jgi:hypothetical protein
MLGLQQKEEEETADDGEGQCLNSHEYTRVLISTAESSEEHVNEEQHLKDSTDSLSEDKIWKPVGGEEIKCGDDSSQRPLAIASGCHEMKVINFKLKNNESNREASDGSENNEIYNAMNVEEAKKWTTNFLKNQRYVSSLENGEDIFVENKLYEKTEEIGDDDKKETENKVYKKTNHAEEDEEYDSEEELSSLSQVQRVPEDEKLYEFVPVHTDAEKQVEKETNVEDKEEDDYYCSYDKVSLIHSLSDQRNSSSPEPDLPPRPSVGSNDSSKIQLKHQATKAEDEEADYNIFYESTDSFNTSTSSARLLSSGGDDTFSKIKGSTLSGRIKFKKKKLPIKESVALVDASSNNKKKRKTSFLRRMLKHYHKKPESNSETSMTADNHRSGDEPEYETVVYSVPTLKHDGIEEKQPDHAARLNSNETLVMEVHKERWYGTKSLLTQQTMLELKTKLKVRDDAAASASQVSL